jgi:hypothetical protein
MGQRASAKQLYILVSRCIALMFATGHRATRSIIRSPRRATEQRDELASLVVDPAPAITPATPAEVATEWEFQSDRRLEYRAELAI